MKWYTYLNNTLLQYTTQQTSCKNLEKKAFVQIFAHYRLNFGSFAICVYGRISVLRRWSCATVDDVISWQTALGKVQAITTVRRSCSPSPKRSLYRQHLWLIFVPMNEVLLCNKFDDICHFLTSETLIKKEEEEDICHSEPYCTHTPLSIYSNRKLPLIYLARRDS